MSRRKYFPIMKVPDIVAFELIECDRFIFQMGNKSKTVTRAFLENWQYHTLKNYIEKGMIWFARRKENDK